MKLDTIYTGDCEQGLKLLPDNSIDCCVTSPPYYGLRDYGVQGQIGLEQTPEQYIHRLVTVFEQVRRVLKKEGTLWLNLGDSYAGSGKGKYDKRADKGKQATNQGAIGVERLNFETFGLKPKDLIGIPWMAAFALRAAGWYLRQEIIWHKPNPMPESVTDRCTKGHEQIFLLAKSREYFFDNEAIKTPAKNPKDDERRIAAQANQNKNTPDELRNGIRVRTNSTFGNRDGQHDRLHSGNPYYATGMANKRSVWTVNTKPYKEAHFATFPSELITDCIKAGCPTGGVVLDPFMGAGTTGVTAWQLDRHFIGYELNPEYVDIAEKRLMGYILK